MTVAGRWHSGLHCLPCCFDEPQGALDDAPLSALRVLFVCAVGVTLTIAAGWRSERAHAAECDPNEFVCLPYSTLEECLPIVSECGDCALQRGPIYMAPPYQSDCSQSAHNRRTLRIEAWQCGASVGICTLPSSVTLYYSFNGSSWTSVALNKTCSEGGWTAELCFNQNPGTLPRYFKAIANAGSCGLEAFIVQWCCECYE